MRTGRLGLIAGLVIALTGAGAGVALSLRPAVSADSGGAQGPAAALAAPGTSSPAPAGRTPSTTSIPATPAPATGARVTAASVRAAAVQAAAAGSAAVTATRKAAPKATGGGSTTVSVSPGRIQYGRTYRGRATFYAATGAGNCSYEASSDLMVGAMNQADYDNSRSCGAYLAVTGPSGKQITIKVVDRCPECPPGAIDLSREAFTRLAPASTGQIAITWRLLSPALGTPVSYLYKSGSSQYWCGIQVRGHRNPVATLELRTGSSWIRVPRQDYNYFVSASGAGCGGTIRITDIYGHRLTDTGLAVRPGTAQRGHAQFPGP